MNYHRCIMGIGDMMWRWQGSGQEMAQEGSAAAWRCDYNLPSGQLTGMGQRSASASNLAAMNLPHGDWFGSQDQRKLHPFYGFTPVC